MISPIPYELHLTLVQLALSEEQRFIDFCAGHGGKPLLIELARGKTVSQPMFSEVIPFVSLTEAIAYAKLRVHQLQEAGFAVCRIKLEVPASCASQVVFPGDTASQPYYEWHGRIAYENADALLQLCTALQVHLSRNALRRETTTRFITLREYGAATLFEQRLTLLKGGLVKGGWTLFKEHAEYCVYDDHLALDEGWLS